MLGVLLREAACTRRFSLYLNLALFREKFMRHSYISIYEKVVNLLRCRDSTQFRWSVLRDLQIRH